MENKFLDQLFRSFSLELPPADTMDEYLDAIIPLVRPWGEDLYEKEYYLDTSWLEIREDDDFHEAILHIFRDENEYLYSLDGNISKGKWQILEKSNTFILEQIADDTVVRSELYDLAFLNKDFFILRKHGDQKRKKQRKYFVMGREGLVRGLEWRDVIELIYDRYRRNSQFITIAVVVMIIVVIFIVFSILWAPEVLMIQKVLGNFFSFCQSHFQDIIY